MSVNVYNKSSDSLNPIAGRTPDDKVSKSNVLNTLEEISASTNPLDVAGASAVRELSSELGGFKPVIDETTGQITGYKTSIGGADTVFPFKGISETYVVDPTSYARFDGNNSAGTRSWSKPSSEYNYCIWTMLNQNYANRVVINSVTGASIIAQLNCYVSVDAPCRANTLFLKVDNDTFSVNYRPFQTHQIGLIWIK